MDAQRSPSRVVRGRLGVVAAAALTVMMLASAVSLVLPRVWHVETRLETKSTGAMSQDDLAARVDTGCEQIRSHEVMDQACRKLALDAAFSEADRNERREELLQELRESTKVSASSDGAAAVVTIAYAGDQPDVAVRVLGELAEIYKGLSFDQPTADAQKAVEAAEAAEKAAKAVVEMAANEHREYRGMNAEFLDGAKDKLAQTQHEIKQVEQVEIAALDRKKKELESFLEKETAFVVVKARQPDAARLKTVDDRIHDVKETLSRLKTSQKLADTHPDVVVQTETLKRLEAERQRLIDEAPMVEQRQSNEQFVALAKELREILGKLGTANLKRTALREQERDQRELARRTPEIVAEAERLAAAEATAKSGQDARAAELAASRRRLEDLRARGTLTIRQLDAPSRPDSPSGPGALLLGIAGLGTGAAAGLVLAFALNAMDRSFRDAGAVSQFLGVPTLGAVHAIETPVEAGKRRKGRRRRAAGLAAYALVAAVVLAVALFGDAHAIVEFVRSVVG